MKIITDLLNLIRRLLKFYPRGLSRVEDYLDVIISAFKTARDVYYEDVLPKITKKITWDEAKSVIYSYISDKSKVDIMMFDGSYYVPKLDVFKVIDKTGIQRMFQYRKEVFDCDDFAWAFKAYASEVFLINAVGMVIGKVIDEDGKVGYHAWNMVLVYEDDKIVPYTVEPQTDNYARGLEVKIGNWKYEPMTIIM